MLKLRLLVIVLLVAVLSQHHDRLGCVAEQLVEHHEQQQMGNIMAFPIQSKPHYEQNRLQFGGGGGGANKRLLYSDATSRDRRKFTEQTNPAQMSEEEFEELIRYLDRQQAASGSNSGFIPNREKKAKYDVKDDKASSSSSESEAAAAAEPLANHRRKGFFNNRNDDLNEAVQEQTCASNMVFEPNRILDSKNSVANGAMLLGVEKVVSKASSAFSLVELEENCRDLCCSTDTCDSALLSLKIGDEGYRCYLFKCSEHCIYIKHNDYVSIRQKTNEQQQSKPTNPAIKTGQPKDKSGCNKKSQFTCVKSGLCIAIYDVCDSIAHCDDKSDEVNCTRSVAPGQTNNNNNNNKPKPVMIKPASASASASASSAAETASVASSKSSSKSKQSKNKPTMQLVNEDDADLIVEDDESSKDASATGGGGGGGASADDYQSGSGDRGGVDDATGRLVELLDTNQDPRTDYTLDDDYDRYKVLKDQSAIIAHLKELEDRLNEELALGSSASGSSRSKSGGGGGTFGEYDTTSENERAKAKNKFKTRKEFLDSFKRPSPDLAASQRKATPPATTSAAVKKTKFVPIFHDGHTINWGTFLGGDTGTEEQTDASSSSNSNSETFLSISDFAPQDKIFFVDKSRSVTSSLNITVAILLLLLGVAMVVAFFAYLLLSTKYVSRRIKWLSKNRGGAETKNVDIEGDYLINGLYL